MRIALVGPEVEENLAARMGRAVGYDASLTEVQRVLDTRSLEVP